MIVVVSVSVHFMAGRTVAALLVVHILLRDGLCCAYHSRPCAVRGVQVCCSLAFEDDVRSTLTTLRAKPPRGGWTEETREEAVSRFKTRNAEMYGILEHGGKRRGGYDRDAAARKFLSRPRKQAHLTGQASVLMDFLLHVLAGVYAFFSDKFINILSATSIALT